MNILFFQGFAVIIICLLALISIKIKDEIYIREDIPHKIRRSGYVLIRVNEIVIVILAIILLISLVW